MSDKGLREFLDWVDQTNEALIKSGYMVVHIPPVDLLPYSDMALNTEMSDRVNAALDLIMDLESQAQEKDEDPNAVKLSLSGEFTYDQLNMVETALLIYKTVLMTLHKDKVKQGIADVIKAIGKAQKEGWFDELRGEGR